MKINSVKAQNEKEIRSNVSYRKAEEVLCPFVILLSEKLIFQTLFVTINKLLSE